MQVPACLVFVLCVSCALLCLRGVCRAGHRRAEVGEGGQPPRERARVGRVIRRLDPSTVFQNTPEVIRAMTLDESPCLVHGLWLLYLDREVEQLAVTRERIHHHLKKNRENSIRVLKFNAVARRGERGEWAAPPAIRV